MLLCRCEFGAWVSDKRIAVKSNTSQQLNNNKYTIRKQYQQFANKTLVCIINIYYTSLLNTSDSNVNVIPYAFRIVSNTKDSP